MSNLIDLAMKYHSGTVNHDTILLKKKDGVLGSNVGRVYIMTDLACEKESRAASKDMFSRLVILDARPSDHHRVIDYLAVSEDFGFVPEGSRIPVYDASFSKHSDGSVTFDGFEKVVV